MPRPRINYDAYVKSIPQHTSALPPEASVPIRHYVRLANDAWNLLVYIERNLRGATVYGASLNRHMRNLRVMVSLTLVEALERFLKELAAACIDQVGTIILDDRLDRFTGKGSNLAWHFTNTGSLGSVLCESLTWCDCKDANDRFHDILSDPYQQGTFYVFPKDQQQPAALRGKYELMSIIWQLRHSIAHNGGVITASDAYKLRMLSQATVVGNRRFDPTKGDVWYVKLFLDETVENINREVGTRLAIVTYNRSHGRPFLFDAGDKAASPGGSLCRKGGIHSLAAYRKGISGVPWRLAPRMTNLEVPITSSGPIRRDMAHPVAPFFVARPPLRPRVSVAGGQGVLKARACRSRGLSHFRRW